MAIVIYKDGHSERVTKRYLQDIILKAKEIRKDVFTWKYIQG